MTSESSGALLSVLLLLTAATGPVVQKNAGRAPYALQNPTFPCDAFFQSVSGKPKLRISFVWNTFRKGYDPTCLDRVLNDPRLTTLQVTLVNETCARRGDCARRELLYRHGLARWERGLGRARHYYTARLKRYMTRAYNYIIPKLKDSTGLYVTPFLESQMRGAAARQQIAIAREVFGARALIGFNPYGNKPAHYGQDYTELHGRADPIDDPYIVNLDGEQLDFTNTLFVQYFLEIHEGAMLAFLWTGADNCGGPKAGEPNKRQCRPDNNFRLAGGFV
jgi:hypothetical protein